ncbi:YoaK family protein [Paraburkholderia caffeinilytica]|uniref:YoaK family protein n=1 Tax=Paraburkholderia caffeinilytica TaxID=1761016 RepID=UPI0038BB48DA
MKYEDNALAVIAGFVDTLGFVALFGLFTAHVTGNFILIGAEVAGYGQGVLMKLMAFPAFIAGVMLSSVLIKTIHPEGALRSACLLYSVQAILLLGFCLLGVKVAPVVDVDKMPVVLCGMLGAAAMGVQNAHARLVTRPGVPHTVMTGNVTQAVLDVLDIASRKTTADTRSVARARLAKTLQAVICFAVGAMLGAGMYRLFSFWALLLPLAVLVWLAVSTRGGEPSATPRPSASGPAV